MLVFVSKLILKYFDKGYYLCLYLYEIKINFNNLLRLWIQHFFDCTLETSYNVSVTFYKFL
jgi:hypothetical protein